MKLGPEVSKVTYDHVSFAYQPDRPVLEDISFEVDQGEILALVGPSGSGKTTLVNLLLRFYDPVKGAVKINGIDLRKADVHSLRNLIGVVSQEIVLFNATVAENIAYGKPDAAGEEVRLAARAAYAEGFIGQLPLGFKTPVGERGLKLSGGQRQRIAIARAILKNPPILIFDEATSHLDTESEREVQLAIESLMQGRTVMVIAHRLSTVQRASKILVIEDGKIVQSGTNESLLKQGGIYKRLHDLQFNL